MHILQDEFINQSLIEPTFRQANGISKNVLDYVLSDTPERDINQLDHM